MAETKKESFRKYLESAGVIDALTKGMAARQFLLLQTNFLRTFIIFLGKG